MKWRNPIPRYGRSRSTIWSTRPDRLVLPRLRLAVVLEHRLEDAPRFGGIVADDAGAGADGSLDLRLVAADLLAVPAQDLVLALDALEAAADVAGVGVARNGPQRPLRTSAANQDREALLDRRRVVPDRLSPVVLLAGRALAVEHAAHDADRLIQPAQALARRAAELDPERAVLGLEPGAADAQHRPAAADVVERGRHLGDERRVAERVGTDHEPDGGALGALGPGGQGQPALEHRSLVGTDDGIEVVPGPDRVEAEAVGPDAGLSQRGPVAVLVP